MNVNVRGKDLKDLKIVENMKTKKKEELNKEDFQEKKTNDLMTVAQKEQFKVKRKLEQRFHRQ